MAGFSGIAIAIGNRGGEIDDLTRWRNSNLLMFTLGAAFGAVQPMLFDSFGLSGSELWFASSLGFLPICLLCQIRLFVSVQRLSVDDRNHLSPVLWYLGLFGCGTAALAQLANAFDFWGDSFAGPIFAGVLWLLFLSTSQFVRILSGLPRRPAV